MLFNTIPEKDAASFPAYAIIKKQKIKELLFNSPVSHMTVHVHSKEGIRNWQYIKNEFTMTKVS